VGDNITSVPGPVNATDAIAFAGSGGLLLDVRENNEWDAGHAPSARHIPMSELNERVAELPTDETIFVICHSGGRSQQVTTALVDAGYPAQNVLGGMIAWQLAGGVVTEAGSQPPRV
jgi:rhodanese-related sulfurtransferase